MSELRLDLERRPLATKAVCTIGRRIKAAIDEGNVYSPHSASDLRAWSVAEEEAMTVMATSMGAGPLRAFAARLALVGLVAFAIIGLRVPRALGLLLIGVATVIMIVTDKRFKWELWLEEHNIPSREAWAPLLMLVIIVGANYITVDKALDVMAGKVDIIAFILSFAVLAEGLRRSGFFRYMAYQFTERCGGDTARLFIYLFLLSSLATYVTSNDIVILVLTPIVISVALRARIPNAKLLLLSQFVAANTVSMGLMIGSPTNLIVARTEGIDFFKYFFIMLIPSLVALFGTLTFVSILNRKIQGLSQSSSTSWLAKRFSSWSFIPSYQTPRFTDNMTLTRSMRHWIVVLLCGLSLVILATGFDFSLFWAAIPITAASLALIALGQGDGRFSATSKSTQSPVSALRQTIGGLPYGVVFFGLSFFVLAAAIANTDFVASNVTDFVSTNAQSQPLLMSFGSIFGSGALVNLLNDLPASALLGNVLHGATFATPFAKEIVTQGVLIGVNIGTYVTPVGALAGIIWFDLLRKEKRENPYALDSNAPNIEVPTRGDLVLYGSMSFIVLGLLLAITTYTTVSLADWLLGPFRGHSLVEGSPLRVISTLIGVAILTTFFFLSRAEMRRHKVLMVHMVDIFVISNKIRFWIARHRFAWALMATTATFGAIAALLYWVETFYASTYHTAPLFDGPNEYLNWFTVILSAESNGENLPRTILGSLLAGLLALGSIAAIIVLVRATTLGRNDATRLKIASGELPERRLVIANASDDEIDLVRSILSVRRSISRFVVILGIEKECESIISYINELHADRSFFIDAREIGASSIRELRLDEASEIFLLSHSRRQDFANAAFLTALDRAIELRRPIGHEPESAHSNSTDEHGGPVVIAQVHVHSGRQLIEERPGAGSRCKVTILEPANEFSQLLIAIAEGGPSGLERFVTSEPPSDSNPLKILGSIASVASETDSRALSQAAHTPGDGISKSSRIFTIGNGEFAIAAANLVASNISLPVTTFQPSDSRTTGDLPDVRLVSHPDDVVRQIEDEAREGDLIIAFDDTRSGYWGVDEVLEAISLSKLRSSNSHLHSCFTLVQCTGADRQKFLSRFMVDQVVDSRWSSLSYLAAFAHVYYGSTGLDELRIDDGTRIRSSEHIAHFVQRFSVRPADLEIDDDGFELGAHLVGLPYRFLADQTRSNGGDFGFVLGGLRTTAVHQDGENQFVITLVSSDSEETVLSDDLILGFPNLQNSRRPYSDPARLDA